jgi:hypothetical protein
MSLPELLAAVLLALSSLGGSPDTAERESISIEPDRGSSRSAMPELLATIKHHESRGDYTAVNPSGCEGYGCGGAYQLHAAYASTWAARAGYPHMPADASTWPPATQDAVALHLFHSTTPPGSHWCDWADYC